MPDTHDSRIRAILDAGNLAGTIADADLDDAKFIIIGDVGANKTVAEIRNKIFNDGIISESRAPTESDRVAGLTTVFFDRRRGHTYISHEGGHWEYQPSQGSRSFVYVGPFEKTTGTVDPGKFKTSASHLKLGVTSGSALWHNVSALYNNDIIYVGSNRFDVTNRSYSSTGGIIEFTLNGAWANTYSGLTFSANEIIHYTRQRAYRSEDLWSGTLYRSQTSDSDIQTLNAGKNFLDYDFLIFEFNANSVKMVSIDRFASNLGRDLDLQTHQGVIWIRYVSRNSFRTVGGHGDDLNMRLNRITGYKAV